MKFIRRSEFSPTNIAQGLGILAAVLCLLGIFMPVISVPVLGGMSLWRIRDHIAITLFIIAGGQLLFSIRSFRTGILTAKIAIGLLLLFILISEWRVITGHASLLNNIIQPFIRIGWGAGFLLTGILLLLLAPLPAKSSKRSPTHEMDLSLNQAGQPHFTGGRALRRMRRIDRNRIKSA